MQKVEIDLTCGMGKVLVDGQPVSGVCGIEFVSTPGEVGKLQLTLISPEFIIKEQEAKVTCSMMHKGDHYDAQADTYVIGGVSVARSFFKFFADDVNTGKAFRLVSSAKHGSVIIETTTIDNGQYRTFGNPAK